MAYTIKQLDLARQRVSSMNAKQLQTRMDRMTVQGKLEAFAIALRERLYGLSIQGNSSLFKKYISLFRICIHKCGFSPTACLFTNESIKDSTWSVCDVHYLMDERYLRTARPANITTADKTYLRFMYGHDSILRGADLGGRDAYIAEQVDESYIALLRGTGSLETNPPVEASPKVSNSITFQVPLARSRIKRPRRNLNL